jgi:hypothetical protein
MLDAKKPSECSTCHASKHAAFRTEACTECHRTDMGAFALARGRMAFDHATTGFALERRHKSLTCAACHPTGGSAAIGRCESCHADPHAGQLTARCDDCHRPDRWRLVRFDHDQTGWPLRGRHFVTPCASCHTSQRWIGPPPECWDCHAYDAAGAPRSVPAHKFGRTDCSECHNTWTFKR